MKSDEQQPRQGPYLPPAQPEPSWSYGDEAQQPPPPMRPPSGYLPNNPNNPNNPNSLYANNPNSLYPYNNIESGPLAHQENNPVSQFPADAYYPDLTMDMGNSLGYSQGIQHHAMSMPQPTQSIPRLRQERFQQLREDRMRRQQRRLGPAAATNSIAKGPIGVPPGAFPSGPLQDAGNIPIQPRPNSALLPPGAGASLQPAIEPAQDTSMIQRVKVARASSLIGGAFMVSSILGLVQTFLFTYIFGRGLAGESYLQAYIIPNLIYTVIAGGALSSAFIPVFTTYSVKYRDEKSAWHIASSALNISVSSMIVFSVIAFFLAPVLVPLYSRPEEVQLIVTLTRIMLVQAIVLGSGVIIGAILNTKEDFTRTALGTMLYNVGLNLGLLPGFLLTFHSQASSPGNIAVYAAVGVVLGALLQVGVQIPGLFQVKMQYTFAFDWRHPGVQQIGRQMVPRVINAMMLSASTMVDRALLSLLSVGLINGYLQAFSILLLPVTLFGSSVSTAAFPTLADYAARGRFERVRTIIMETLRGILFLTIPSGVGLLVLSFPITQALLEHGNFDLTATNYAAIVLFFFALGLPALAAVEILTRSFYALQDSKTPVTISVIQFILKIALSIILVNAAIYGTRWGLAGLAFSTSIASTFEALVLFFLLSRRIEGFELQPLFKFFNHVLLASGALAIVLFVMQTGLNHIIDTTRTPRLDVLGILLSIMKLLIELGAGVVTFLVVARLLKMEEMNSGLVRRVLNILRVPWL